MPRNNKPTARLQASKPGVHRGRPRRARHLTVRSELKSRPDVRRIARAVIELALAQAELDAAQSCQVSAAASRGDQTAGQGEGVRS